MLVDLDYDKFIVQDGVSVDVKPLNVRDYQRILRYIADLGIVGEDADEAGVGIDQFSRPEVAILIKDILPAYSANLEGVQIKQHGKVRDAKIKDLIEHSAFLSMCFSILFQIFTISSIKEEEHKEIKK